MADERRRYSGRIIFRMPRAATFGSHKVVLADLGSRGAGIRHSEQLSPGMEDILAFRLEREQHAVRCVLRRSKLELVNVGNTNAQIYHSGLQFAAVDASESVRIAIRKRIERALLRQHADAWADPSVMKDVMDESSGSFSTDLLTSWMNKQPFVRCTLDRGRWRKERVADPTQPLVGFTVSVEEEEREIELLCRTFEESDKEQRELIRLFASLAITEPSDVPHEHFSP